jgi:3-methyladenine DNA glycosylase AlkD
VTNHKRKYRYNNEDNDDDISMIAKRFTTFFKKAKGWHLKEFYKRKML